MLCGEVVDVSVVLGKVLPAALAAAILGMVLFCEGAIDLPGMEEADLLIVKVLVPKVVPVIEKKLNKKIIED